MKEKYITAVTFCMLLSVQICFRLQIKFYAYDKTVKISQPFKINTGVRQGDGLSPIIFNCVLEKVVRICNEKLNECKILPIMLGRRNKHTEINCLAFADDFAIL